MVWGAVQLNVEPLLASGPSQPDETSINYCHGRVWILLYTKELKSLKRIIRYWGGV
jgi:hypothetical protein